MENEALIAIEVCCTQYNIEVSFVRSLGHAGLIEVVTVEDMDYVHKDNISELEKMIRLHYEMDVNIEGIEIISHLLERVDLLQEEVRELRNRLKLYED